MSVFYFHGCSHHLQWFWSPPKIMSVTVSTVSPSICHGKYGKWYGTRSGPITWEVMGPDAMILIFWMLSFKPTFSLSSFTFIKQLFSCSLLSAIRVVSSAYLRLLIFIPAILIPACASSSYPRLKGSLHIARITCFFLPPALLASMIISMFECLTFCWN